MTPEDRQELRTAGFALVLPFLLVGCCLLSTRFVGCSDDGDTVIYKGGELSNSDSFPASSIAANNLAPDASGMSRNDRDVVGSRSVVAFDSPASDGDSTGLSNDGLLLFRTQRDGSQELGVSHFDGASSTAPTQLRAPDMDPAHPIRIGGR